MASKEVSILLVAKDLASGNINKVKSELGGLSAQGKVAAIGLGTAERAATGLGGALSHAKGLITSNLGLIGLSAGALSLGGAFESGVSRAEDMALAVEKLSGVTGMTAHSASQLLAVFEKFGIDADRTTAVAAFAEKTLGKLANTQSSAAKSAQLLVLEQARVTAQLHGQSTKLIDLQIKHQKLIDKQDALASGASKLAALDAQYGLHLVDNKGKLASFADELGQVADLWINKQIPAAQKATVAAQLFGRSYVNLVPVLQLGSKGIAEAAAEADKMGLTLKSAQDVRNVHDFIAAQRQAKDAIAGLEVQLGLLVMPDLTGAFKTFTKFIVDNRSQILGVFHDAVGFAKQVAAAVLTIGGAFKSAWDAVPAPLRQILLEGFIANKAIKVVFGIDPLKIIEGGIGSALKGALGGLFQRGGSPAAPVYTKEVGAPGGAVPTGGGGGLSKLATAVSIVSIAADALAVFTAWRDQNEQSTQQANALQQQQIGWLSKNPSREDVVRGLAAVDQGIADIRNNPLLTLVQGEALTRLQQMDSSLRTYLANQSATGRAITAAFSNLPAQIAGAFNSGGIIGAINAVVAAIHGVNINSAPNGGGAARGNTQTPGRGGVRGNSAAPSSGDHRNSRAGFAHAAGLLAMTQGATDLGVAGEAGKEAVAIVKNPKGIGKKDGLPVYVTNWPGGSSSSAATAAATGGTEKWHLTRVRRGSPEWDRLMAEAARPIHVTVKPAHVSAREVMNADRQWRRVTSANGSGVSIR